MIISSIKRGAKSFARAFKQELAAQKIARGTLALNRQAEQLDSMSPEQQAQYHADQQEILARSSELVRKAREPKIRYWRYKAPK